MSEIEKKISLVKNSGLFDTDWYLTEYPDVKKLEMDPIEHYLWIGARMERNPSPDFDTAFYLSTHPRVAEKKFNPLLHYINLGKKEGYKTAPPPGDRPRTSGTQIVFGSQEAEEELRQENELLLLQLHQVQEELEKYYLKYQDLKNKDGD